MVPKKMLLVMALLFFGVGAALWAANSNANPEGRGPEPLVLGQEKVEQNKQGKEAGQEKKDGQDDGEPVGAERGPFGTLAELQLVRSIVWSPDGSFLLIRHGDGLGVWDTKTGQYRVGMEDKYHRWDCIAISPDGKRAAAIALYFSDKMHRDLKIWDVATGKVVEEQTLPEWKTGQSPQFLQFSPDGAFLYAVWDKQILEAKVGGKNRLLPHKLDNWGTVAIDLRARLLIAVRHNDSTTQSTTAGQGQIQNPLPPKQTGTTPTQSGTTTALQNLPQPPVPLPKQQSSTLQDPPLTFEEWQARNKQQSSTLQDPLPKPVRDNEGKPVAQLGFFNLDKVGEPQSFPLTDLVASTALSPDGKTLAISYDRRFTGKPKLELWDVATKRRRSLPVDTRKGFQYYDFMEFAPDGKTLAGTPFYTDSGWFRSRLDVFDLEGKISQEITRYDVSSLLAFSPDGKTLAVFGSTANILFVDPATGETRRPPGAAPPQVVKKEKKPREQNEAEKLFRAMEKKIKDARAFEVVFTYQLQEGKTTKGSLLLTNDNKARLRVSGPFSFNIKDRASFELVSDGKRFKLKGAELIQGSNGQSGFRLGGEKRGQTPKAFYASHTAEVCCVGISAMVLGLPYVLGTEDVVHDLLAETDHDGLEPMMEVYDFKAGAAEKVGGRQATPVHYNCGYEITVWIDNETGLPLRRVIPNQEARIRFTETYSEWKLDPRIDARAFDLPK